eukprot:scaffold115749_cov21-Tisochrysis_lutea.AAC.2
MWTEVSLPLVMQASSSSSSVHVQAHTPAGECACACMHTHTRTHTHIRTHACAGVQLVCICQHAPNPEALGSSIYSSLKPVESIYRVSNRLSVVHAVAYSILSLPVYMDRRCGLQNESEHSQWTNHKISLAGRRSLLPLRLMRLLVEKEVSCAQVSPYSRRPPNQQLASLPFNLALIVTHQTPKVILVPGNQQLGGPQYKAGEAGAGSHHPGMLETSSSPQ